MLIIKQNSFLFCSDLEVDYESEESASIVYAALAVDKEVMLHVLKLCLCSFHCGSISFLSDSIYNFQLQPDKVKRQMSVSNGKLSV